MGDAVEDAWDSVTGAVDDVWSGFEHTITSERHLLNGDFEDFIDDAAGGNTIWGQLWRRAGGTEHWENALGGMSGMFGGGAGGSGGYDLSSVNADTSVGSKCSGKAKEKEADTTAVPAVAKSVSEDAANAVAAQNTARKRARGILSTYTRYEGGDGSDGKTKLGE